MFETTNQMSLTISNSSHRSSKSHQSQSTVASPQLAEDWLKRERQCLRGMSASNHVWLVVSTLLKNISQLGWFFPIYPKIKNVPNHQPDVCLCVVFFLGRTVNDQWNFCNFHTRQNMKARLLHVKLTSSYIYFSKSRCKNSRWTVRMSVAQSLPKIEKHITCWWFNPLNNIYMFHIIIPANIENNVQTHSQC